MDPTHFRAVVIDPTLLALNLWSRSASDLLLGTALAESGLERLTQYGGGPALGPYQCEPETHDDIWGNFLVYRDQLRTSVAQFLAPSPSPVAQLSVNLAYATAIARIHYLRVPEAIPETLSAKASYWKRHYNTSLGAGTEQHYMGEWRSNFPLAPPVEEPEPFPSRPSPEGLRRIGGDRQ